MNVLLDLNGMDEAVGYFYQIVSDRITQKIVAKALVSCILALRSSGNP